MFIDFLTVVLINLSAGLTIAALFVFKYVNADRKKMAPGFLITGFLALATGLDIVFTWPLPGSYNIPFGEMSVLFGVVAFMAGIAVLRDWDLLTLSIYAVFAGAASIMVGARIMSLKLTNAPLLSFAGFALTGLAGVLSLPAYLLRKSPVVRFLSALLLVGCAAIWAVFAFEAYWSHMSADAFGKWVPTVMRALPGAK